MVDGGTVTSADGTMIAYEVQGSGPALVVVPGTWRAARHYRVLAEYLADAFTVYVIDRRGRAGSGPKGPGYGVGTECADLAAVLEKVGPAVVFGHSYGGFVALEYARTHPVDRLVVYEPALSIAGSIRDDWLPDLERAVAAGDHGRAIALMVGELAGDSVLARIPARALRAAGWLFARTPMGRGQVDLLPTVASEVREVGKHTAGGRQYREVTARTLVLYGGRSSGWVRGVCAMLAAVVADGEAVRLPGTSHNAPDEDAQQAVAAALRRFLTTRSAH